MIITLIKSLPCTSIPFSYRLKFPFYRRLKNNTLNSSWKWAVGKQWYRSSGVFVSDTSEKCFLHTHISDKRATPNNNANWIMSISNPKIFQMHSYWVYEMDVYQLSMRRLLFDLLISGRLFCLFLNWIFFSIVRYWICKKW